jgi:uncharacterized repeat protein (TIGR01451 family)
MKKLLPILFLLIGSFAKAQLYSTLVDSFNRAYHVAPFNTTNNFYTYSEHTYNDWDTSNFPIQLHLLNPKSEKLERVLWRKTKNLRYVNNFHQPQIQTDSNNIYIPYRSKDRFTILKVRDSNIIDSINVFTKIDSIPPYSWHYDDVKSNGRIALVKTIHLDSIVEFYAIDLRKMASYKFLTSNENFEFDHFLLYGTTIYCEQNDSNQFTIVRANLKNSFDTTHIAHDRFISPVVTENFIYYQASNDSDQIIIKRFDTTNFKIESIGGLPNLKGWAINIKNAGVGVYVTSIDKICLNKENVFNNTFESPARKLIKIKGHYYFNLNDNSFKAVDPSSPKINAKLFIDRYNSVITKNFIYTTTTPANQQLIRFDKNSFTIENLSPFGFKGYPIHVFKNDVYHYKMRTYQGNNWVRLYKKTLDGIPVNINTFIDYNKNGIYDNNDVSLNKIKLEINGLQGELYGGVDGMNSIMLNKGKYSIKPSYLDWKLSTDTLISLTLTENNKDTTINIGVYPKDLKSDIDCNISLRRGRCYSKERLVFLTENIGSTVLNTQLRISLDDSIYIDSFSIKPTRVSNDTFIWENIKLEPGITNNEFNKIIAYTRFPGVVALDTGRAFPKLRYSFRVKGESTDGNASNAHEFYQPIRCAYDPNDKTVFPWNPEHNDQTQIGQKLTYRIRFQNTGNDTAYHVKITDTLSTSLDWNSLRILDYSHPMEMKVMENGKRMFLFNNIMLVDSHTNEPASHGFVTFSINHIKDIEEQTEILNTAYIYFDKNPAIVTNTARSVMVSEIVGINDDVSHRKSLDIYPNPATNTITLKVNSQIEWIEIYSVNGKLLSKVTTENGENTLNIQSLKPGLYLLQTHSASDTFQTKFIKE